MPNRVQSTERGLAIETQTATATVTGASLDTSNWNGACELHFRRGTITTGTFALKIQDSADNSTFADVSGKSNPALGTDNSWDPVITFHSREVRQYIRAVATGASTPNGDISGFFLYEIKRE